MPMPQTARVFLLLGLVLVAAASHAADAPVAADTSPADAKPATDAASRPLRMILVGDIMLAQDEATGKLIAQGKDPFEHFAKLLKQSDVAIGNLECVVAERGERVRKPYNFMAHPRCIPLLKQHFSGLTVANNHSCDFGKSALVRQCELFETAGVPYFGGGRNKADAHKPWIVQRGGLKIAMLGYCEVLLRSFQAEENLPGVAWSEKDDVVLADIKAAREKYKADLVIPFMHWGWEEEPANDRQKALARKMIDAGADVVVGAHPHVTQGAEYYKGHLIVYSLGNFVFNGFDTVATRTGWALRLQLDQRGLAAWDTVVVELDEQSGVPRPNWKAPGPSGKRGVAEIIERPAEAPPVQ